MRGLGLVFLLLTACGQIDLPAEGSSSKYASGDLSPCTPLKLPDESISNSLPSFDRKVLLLALSISGSFEGPDDWANITDDFDGQGLSLGLLNQNLGTGSLQPLLIRMRDTHFKQFQSYFSNEQRVKVESMLSLWEAEASNVETANAKSADWARSNLYTENGFKASWKKSFQNLARDPHYINQQIKASISFHQETRRLMNTLGLNNLRSYLFLFDTITQDGSLPGEDVESFLAENRDLSSRESLSLILSLRLRHVKKSFRNDVRIRKLTIIDGAGVVHGTYRNLEQEYCFNADQDYSNN